MERFEKANTYFIKSTVRGSYEKYQEKVFCELDKDDKKAREAELLRKLNRKHKFLDFMTPEEAKINFFQLKKDRHNERLEKERK